MREKTLLLAAHGSSRPDNNSPVRALVERLKADGAFGDVLCGFIKEAPFLTDILPSLTTEELVVIPLLTSQGFITDELIPGALKTVPSSIRVHLCPPLGVHSEIPKLMASRVEDVLSDLALPRDDVSVLVAAHGNKKNPENARQTSAVAQSIEEHLDTISVEAAFIEQSPFLSDWTRNVSSGHLIVLPFLIGGGLHGAEDVPTMLGLDPKGAELNRLSGTVAHTEPLKSHGRSIVICRALGYEPKLAKIISDIAHQI